MRRTLLALQVGCESGRCQAVGILRGSSLSRGVRVGIPVLCLGGVRGWTVFFWGRQRGDVGVDIHCLRCPVFGLLRALVHFHCEVVGSGSGGSSSIEVVVVLR